MIVLRNGWPDFLLIDPVHPLAVGIELKSENEPKTARRPEQVRMHLALQRLGLEVATLGYEDMGELISRIPSWRQSFGKLPESRDELSDWYWQQRGVFTRRRSIRLA